MPIVCKKPKCVLSKDKTKCIKPNPYVQFISYCGKSGKTSDECKDEYYKKTSEIKKNACDYYESNKKVGNIKSCPKSRRPVNNKCPDDYPVAKLNKHKVKCCYKGRVVKKTTKKVKKPTPISSDDIPIKQLKRRTKKIETPFSSAESGESEKQKKRTSTPFSSAESGESRKQKKSTSTPFSSAESIKSPVNPFKNLGNEEENPLRRGDKLYKLAKVQKYRGKLIPAKVEKRRFPAHKIQEVLKELEKPREMAELTQSSPGKGMRKSFASRKTISAPSFIKYQKNQKRGFFDWLKGKQNKPPSQIIDIKLNKKIGLVKQQESDKRHREQYKDLYKKGFNRKEVELLLQADINKGKKGRSLSLSKKPKERKLSNPDLKFGKPQKRGFFDFFKRNQAAPVIDNNLNKRIEMVKQESNKRHREQYKDLYNKGLNRKEIELLNKDLDNKKSKKAKSTSFSFGNKEKNKYQGHMSAPETISLNKGQLRVSVPSLDKKAKEYLDKKLMKKIEGIKSKVPPKKQKGWFQTLFNNESSSKSGEKKQKKKWYEY